MWCSGPSSLNSKGQAKVVPSFSCDMHPAPIEFSSFIYLWILSRCMMLRSQASGHPLCRLCYSQGCLLLCALSQSSGWPHPESCFEATGHRQVVWAIFWLPDHSHYPVGRNVGIHDLFRGAWISRICIAYFLHKVLWDPKYRNMWGKSLAVGAAQQTTENDLEYSWCPQDKNVLCICHYMKYPQEHFR